MSHDSKKKKHKDFDPKQAAAVLQCMVEESKVSVSDASETIKPAPSPDTPEEELPEPSSPVCYAKDFKDW